MIPQLVYIALVFLALGISCVTHGTPKTGNHSVFAYLISLSIGLSLLYWGGFFDVLIERAL